MFFLAMLITIPVLAKNSILIVGDSLSAGYGINPSAGWVALLADKLNENGYDIDVHNISVSGITTSQGLAQLPSALNQYHPQLVVIELGANDGLRGLQLETISSNLQKMIDLSKAVTQKIVLIGLRLPPNYGPVYTQQFQEMFVTLAKKNTLELVPLLLKSVDDHKELVQPDGVHPTEAAQSILLENVWPAIHQSLKTAS
jgi:acyl-CoA thioesterase-1